MKIDVHIIEIMYDVIEHVVSNMDSEDVRNLADELPKHDEAAASSFCERFELGNWFYEAMTLNCVNIAATLDDIASTFEQREIESAKRRQEILGDYHLSVAP